MTQLICNLWWAGRKFTGEDNLLGRRYLAGRRYRKKTPNWNFVSCFSQNCQHFLFVLCLRNILLKKYTWSYFVNFTFCISMSVEIDLDNYLTIGYKIKRDSNYLRVCIVPSTADIVLIVAQVITPLQDVFLLLLLGVSQGLKLLNGSRNQFKKWHFMFFREIWN